MISRAAKPVEADELSRLAFRAKAHWGYDALFMEDCRPELTVTTGAIDRDDVRVLERDGVISGFYSLACRGRDAELVHFWIDPAAMGRGLGRSMWNDAVGRATALGCDSLIIESDPNAEGFYLRMGAEREGEVESPVREGRWLPVLRFRLANGEPEVGD